MAIGKTLLGKKTTVFLFPMIFKIHFKMHEFVHICNCLYRIHGSIFVICRKSNLGAFIVSKMFPFPKIIVTAVFSAETV